MLLLGLKNSEYNTDGLKSRAEKTDEPQSLLQSRCNPARQASLFLNRDSEDATKSPVSGLYGGPKRRNLGEAPEKCTDGCGWMVRGAPTWTPRGDPLAGIPRSRKQR